MRRAFLSLVLLAAVAAAAGLWITRPVPIAAAELAGVTGDPARGAAVYHAAGCASCHSAPGATTETRDLLAGGQRFATTFGTFVAPNISPDPVAGIGGWTLAEFASAVQRGVSPAGAHYFPAFPYAAYRFATLQDVADLHAHMATLPPSPQPNAPHEVGFPFNQRIAVGFWKLLFLPDDWAVSGTLTEAEARGRYLAEALGHCGECHTPRNMLGGSDRGRWLAGAANPSGEGRIPDITPGRLTWTEGEIAEYLSSGFTPDYDSAGGHMALVVQNLARLPPEDRAAIAAYLKRVPPAL